MYIRYILPGSTAEDEQSQPTQTVTENIQASTAFQYIEMSDKESKPTGRTKNEPKIKKIPSKVSVKLVYNLIGHNFCLGYSTSMGGFLFVPIYSKYSIAGDCHLHCNNSMTT